VSPRAGRERRASNSSPARLALVGDAAQTLGAEVAACEQRQRQKESRREEQEPHARPEDAPDREEHPDQGTGDEWEASTSAGHPDKAYAKDWLLFHAPAVAPGGPSSSGLWEPPFGLPMYTPIFAHLGHWYVSLPVFGAPVVVLAVVVKVSDRRARRRARVGDTSQLPVVVTHGGGRTVLAVKGALDYPTLLDIEHHLGIAVTSDPRILIDLRNVTTVEEDLAWSVTDAINSVEGSEITVLIGSAPALHALKEIFTHEGVKVLDGAPAASVALQPKDIRQ
jgi:hypothetical protein